MQRNWHKIQIGHSNYEHEYIIGELSNGEWKILFVRKNLPGFEPEQWRPYYQFSRRYGSADDVCRKNYVTKRIKLSQEEQDQIFIEVI